VPTFSRKQQRELAHLDASSFPFSPFFPTQLPSPRAEACLRNKREAEGRSEGSAEDRGKLKKMCQP